MLEHGSSEGFSWGTSVAGEFVEGSGLPFDSPKPTTDRRSTFIHEISKHSNKIKQQITKCSINFAFIHNRSPCTEKAPSGTLIKLP